MPPGLDDFDESAASDRVFTAVVRHRDLAEALGLSPPTISHMKRQGKCTLELALAAVEITGKPLTWFLYGKSEELDPAAEARLVAKIARSTAEKSAALAKEFAVAEPIADYDLPTVRAQIAALKGRLELLECYYDTFATWMRVVETRLREIEKKEGER